MNAVSTLLAHGSRATSYMLGGIVIVTALIVLTVSQSLAIVTDWALDVLGWGFLALLGGLIFITIFCLIRMLAKHTTIDEQDFWLNVGIQSANGVTTLALTYTLLGISLGIGGLAAQQLSPETVQGVIRDLTGNFSLAFMTTVIGLPLSAGLRALMLIAHGHRQLHTPSQT